MCVFYQTFWTTNNIGIFIVLPTDLKLYKDQNKRQMFSNTFPQEPMKKQWAPAFRYKQFVLELMTAVSPLSEDFW